ncbi:MAG TPA: phosphatase PAP2 family protein [Bacteroidia bacterium]|jgi:membrane-associated phospholipid phosphatase|nr:phosphatase PAP2 family protein [Bacteroidia bacterium]
MIARISALFLLLFAYPSLYQGQNGDINLLRKINVHRNPNLDPAFRVITWTAPVLAPSIPLGTIGVGLYTNDKELTRQGVVCASSVVLALGISTGLKFALKRKRPFAVYDDIQKETKAGPFSFPSGHTTSAFALATAYSLAYPKWYIIAPAYAWAGAIAWSRMHLGVHFPSDVWAGMLIGAGSSLLCYQVQKGIK